MDDAERDTIRLSVPADNAMRPVVEATIGVLARRCGLTDEEVRTARAGGGDALAELSRDHDGDVAIEVRAAHGQLTVHLSGAAGERTLALP